MEAPASTPMKGALLIGNTDGSNGERGRDIVARRRRRIDAAPMSFNPPSLFSSILHGGGGGNGGGGGDGGFIFSRPPTQDHGAG